MNPNDYKPDDYEWYLKKKAVPPKFATHGTEDEIREKMTTLKPTNWRMEGPGLLKADTDMGELVWHLKPDIIIDGFRDDGLPNLTRMKL